MIDIAWNGFPVQEGGDLARGVNQRGAPQLLQPPPPSSAPASAPCCPTMRIMEIDIDDVPWKDAWSPGQPEINAGHMKTPPARAGAPSWWRPRSNNICGKTRSQLVVIPRREPALLRKTTSSVC